MKYFSAVLVVSKDGENVERGEFSSPEVLLYHVFNLLDDSSRKRVWKTLTWSEEEIEKAAKKTSLGDKRDG